MYDIRENHSGLIKIMTFCCSRRLKYIALTFGQLYPDAQPKSLGDISGAEINFSFNNQRQNRSFSIVLAVTLCASFSNLYEVCHQAPKWWKSG